MQQFLRDILKDPPYNLARFANLLLIICIVLLGSIFLLHTEKKDITLNLSFGSEREVVVKGEAQLAEVASAKLYPLAEVGQELKKGDTLGIGIPLEQLKEMQLWIKNLQNGNLVPTKEMLNKYPLPANIKKKMIDIAKEEHAYTKHAKNKLTAADADRIKRVKKFISQFKQEVEELSAAIPKFEALAKSKEAKYFNERDKHARDEISIEQLTKEWGKWDGAKNDVKLRKDQLRTAKGRLYEYNSELAKLSKSKPTPKKKKKPDLVPFEQDLARSLDSLIKSKVVLSQVRGKLASYGRLNDIQAQDTLIYLEGSTERANRSSTIIADANTRDAKNISLNSVSNIILKDGSSVKGKVMGFQDDLGSEAIVRIDTEEEVSYADIEEIIVPAKNANFIQKVMQNF